MCVCVYVCDTGDQIQGSLHNRATIVLTSNMYFELFFKIRIQVIDFIMTLHRCNMLLPTVQPCALLRLSFSPKRSSVFISHGFLSFFFSATLFLFSACSSPPMTPFLVSSNTHTQYTCVHAYTHNKHIYIFQFKFRM